MKHSLIKGESVSDQVTQLWALIDAATRCSQLPELRRNDLFGTPEGIALVNAMHDLTGLDALYDWAADLTRQVEADMAVREQRYCYNPQEREGF